jgi:hypothetical protein
MHNSYQRLYAMAALSFIAMYILMYAMVDSFSSVYNNVNQVYMAGLMASPMILIELWLMRAMYTHRRTNLLIGLGAALLGLLCWTGIRQQAFVGDQQFLRSMIPHHSGAILMCRESAITDARIKELCGAIISSQQTEIATMKALLEGR